MYSTLSSYKEVSMYQISKETTCVQINLFLSFDMPHLEYILKHILYFLTKKPIAL